MENLITKLKEQLIEHLNLEDIRVEDIDTDKPLFGDGLGLDSIDALELIVLLDKEYGIKVASPEEGKQAFSSVQSMATYITSKQ